VNTVRPLSSPPLSVSPFFGGQQPKSGKNIQLYPVIKTSTQQPPLLGGLANFLHAIPWVILFCFIPPLNSLADLKWDVFGQTKVKGLHCGM